MDRPFLSILTDEGVRRVPLGDEVVTIGRGEGNTVIILDLQASRFHCQISRGPAGKWAVKDLDSRNGTKLNGKRIKEAFFGKGDVVRIGTTEFRVMSAPAEAPAATPLAAGSPSAPDLAPAPLEPVVAPFKAVSHPLDPPTALTPMTAPPLHPVPPTISRNAPVALSPVRKTSGRNGKSSADARSPTLADMAGATPPCPSVKHDSEEQLDELEEVIELVEEDQAMDPAAFPPADDDAPLKMEIEPEPPPITTPVSAPELKDRASQETKVGMIVPPSHDDVKLLRELAAPLADAGAGLVKLELLDAQGHPFDIHAADELGKSTFEAAAMLEDALLLAARSHATEVHLDPTSEGPHLRLRLDGVMTEVCRLGKPMGQQLRELVKLLCELDAQQKNVFQEGRFSAQAPGRRVQYRVSFAPSLFGQKMAAQVSDPANAPLHLRDLRMPSWMEEEARRALAADAGLVLVAGTASSGRTTSLYALLRDVGTASRNVMAIEDPVEAEIEGVTQVLVNADQGQPFASLLRSVLRQDPDVVMVGELREPEIGRLAAGAAGTGKLVLSSLYARDVASAAARLVEWGISPYAVGSAVQMILAQRLVRRLCPHCRRAVAPTAEQRARLGKEGETLSEIFVPTGCDKCLKTGFSGRTAFFEALVPTDEAREAMEKASTPREMERAVAGLDFERLAQAGYRLVAQGITPIDEAERALGPRTGKR